MKLAGPAEIVRKWGELASPAACFDRSMEGERTTKKDSQERERGRKRNRDVTKDPKEEL